MGKEKDKDRKSSRRGPRDSDRPGMGRAMSMRQLKSDGSDRGGGSSHRRRSSSQGRNLSRSQSYKQSSRSSGGGRRRSRSRSRRGDRSSGSGGGGGPPLTDPSRRTGLERQVSDNSDSMAMLLGLANKKKPRKRSSSDSDSSGSSNSSLSSKGSAAKAPPQKYNPTSSLARAGSSRALDLSSHSGKNPKGTDSSFDTDAQALGTNDDASQSHLSVSRLAFPTSTPEKAKPPPANTFVTRPDMREGVNQSVNLMDLEQGSGRKKNPNALTKKKKGGLVDVWLDQQQTSQSTMATNTSSLSVTGGTRQNSFVRHKKNPYLKVSAWENFTFFLKDSCRSVKDFFGSVIQSRICVGIVLAVVVVGIVLPVMFGGKRVKQSSKLLLPVGHDFHHDGDATGGDYNIPLVPLKSRPVVVTIEHEGILYLKPAFTKAEAQQRTKRLEQIVSEHRMNPKWTGSGDAAARAIEWMASYDPARLDMDELDVGDVLQRYALAVFFFTTHPDTTANRTMITDAMVEDDDDSESREDSEDIASVSSVLVEDSETEGRSNPEDNEDETPTRGQQDERRIDTFGANWMMEDNICSWQGIQCADEPLPNVVVALNMSRSMLQGTLPPELALLKELQHMDFGHNDLAGNVPDVYVERMANLEALWLQDNLFTGMIPDAIGEWSQLTCLNLAQNKFSGNLPASMAQLTELQLLFLQENLLSGPVPSFGDMEQLEYLYLNHNDFTGQIPEELFEIKALVDVRMEYNDLSGSLPSAVKRLHNLEVLSLGNNNLTGQLPDDFKNMKHLVALDLHKNDFTGTLPHSLGHVSLLEHLLLDHNLFTGTLPTTMFQLERLRTVVLHHNKFHGSIPPEISGLVNLHDLWLDHNALSGTIPEELGDLESIVNIYLHENKFSGSLPSSLNKLSLLGSLRLYQNDLTGEISLDMCELKSHFSLGYIAADCASKVRCSCCDKCY